MGGLIATRWALAPKYLFYIDNINYALAVRDFNPLAHQPQPPGYPLYVALLKLLNLFLPFEKYVQLVAGLIGSLAALLLIWQMGRELFDEPAGWLAAALLFFQPSFWLAGIGNHIRTFLAAGATAVALSAWRSWRSPESMRWLYCTAASLGLAAGFRPELLVLLFPLFCSALLRRRPQAVQVATALAILGLVSLTWFAAILWKTGGLSGLVTLYAHYYQTLTRTTTVFSGASTAGNVRNAVRATYWTGAGVLSWIWALPFVWRRMRLEEVRAQLTLLAWWFVPPFLFGAIIYVHDPDAMLVIIPVTALVGAWVLSLWVQNRGPSAALIALLAMGINAAMFFASPLRQGKDASYAWVKRVGTESTGAIDGIRALSANRSAVVVMNRSLVTPRQIAYAFPGLPLVALESDLRLGCPNGKARFELPVASRVIWFPPLDGSLPASPSFQMERKVAYRDVTPGTAFQAGACEFFVAPR